MTQDTSLPNDVAACHALIEQQRALNEQQAETNEKLARANEQLAFEVEELKRYIYGRRSERYVEDDSQLTFFDEASDVAAEADNDAEVVLDEITYRRRKPRRKSDRFPDHIPREPRTIDVPEEERACPCCGEEMPVIDTDVRERLEYIPATQVVHELHYKKRACGKCKQGVAVAAPPAANAFRVSAFRVSAFSPVASRPTRGGGRIQW